MAIESIIEKYQKRPIVGDIYNEANLKVLLDDLLNEYLVAKEMKRNYMLTDIKNLLGTGSVLCGAVATYVSLQYKFQAIFNILLVAVVVYFVLRSIVFLLDLYEDRAFCYGNFYLKSSANKDALYSVEKYESRQKSPVKYSRSLFELFDNTGRMDHVLFLADLDEFFNKKAN